MPSYTLGQLDAACLDRVDGNAVFYTKRERTSIINESIGILNLYAGFYQKAVPIAGFSQPRQLFYKTPAGIIIPTRVSFEQKPLRRTSVRTLGRSNRRFALDDSAKCGPPASWAPVGIGIFLIHPMDAIGGNDITVTGIATPPELVNDGDVMVLQDEFAEIVSEYFGHAAPLKEGGQIFADATGLYKIFLSKMKQKGIHENLRLPSFFLKSIDEGGKQ